MFNKLSALNILLNVKLVTERKVCGYVPILKQRVFLLSSNGSNKEE